MKPADCIELGHGRWIPKHAISFEAIRASGPGGQHVNKVATAVRMRVVLEHVKGLNAESRQRLVALLGKREKEGIAMLRSGASRSPQTNRRTAIKRFADLVHAAATPPPERKATAPTRSSVRKRLSDKKHHSAKKRQRGERDFESRSVEISHGVQAVSSTPIRPFRTTPILRTVSPAASNFAVTPSANVGRTMRQ